MQRLQGFIMLHRKILEWGWYTDPVVSRVFIHLLLNASFKPAHWRGLSLKPGQVVTGRKALAEQLALSERQVRTALSKLTATGEITVMTTNRFSVVTIVNWAVYQAMPAAEACDMTNKSAGCA